MFQFLKRSWHLISFHFPFCVILPPPIPMSPQSRTSLVSHYPIGIKGQLKLHKAAETTQIINKKHQIFPLEPRMPGEHCRSIILKQVNWGIFSKQQHIKSKCKETQPKLVLKQFVASHWTTHTTSERQRNHFSCTLRKRSNALNCKHLHHFQLPPLFSCFKQQLQWWK